MNTALKTKAAGGFRNQLLALTFLVLAAGVQSGRADATYVFAVQLSAVVQTNPAQISLSWQPDPFGAVSYSVFRKAKNATDWGDPVAVLPGSTLTYTDTAVAIGSAYEYGFTKSTTNLTGWSTTNTGYGYIYAGINAGLIENRGKLLLVVATNSTASLSNELATLQSDLVGDGWLVLRHEVSSNDTPAAVRSLITNDYYKDPENVNALLLFGHVPILQSGLLDYDGHGARPMPADAYYGDVLDDWPTNTDSSPSYLPSDVQLMIGRVDFFDMPGNGAPVPWPNETELLRNYLNKDHHWRTGQISVQRRALMGNRRGDGDEDQATAASGYRNFDPLVGAGNTVEANIQDWAPPDERWISMLSAGSYLWAYGNGGGSDNSISALGLDASNYFNVYSTDIVAMDAQVPFVMLFGSHFGNWDHTDDIERSVLATPSMGLACCEAGEPHWFFHHMGLGEIIGYSTRLTMNNGTLYTNQANDFARAVFIALMGDPTLRLDPVLPPQALSATWTSGGAVLSWASSADVVVGYHLYRAPSPDGPFVRLTDSPIAGTTFTDSGQVSTCTYMVRAVKLQTTPSGTYFNPSQGVSASLTPPAPILTGGFTNQVWQVQFVSAGSGLRYTLQRSLDLQTWVPIASGVSTANITVALQDTNPPPTQAFYRVAVQ